jgi:hypothetical protein
VTEQKTANLGFRRWFKEAFFNKVSLPRTKAQLLIPPLLLCLFSCVSLEQLPPGAVPASPTPTSATGGYPDLEPGNTSVTSAHMTLKGYSQTDLETLKLVAESLYSKIGSDTGLYSFLASENYTLVAYRDRDEYLKKTKQPAWSHAVVSGKTLYFYYPADDLEPVLIHNMTHMVLESYLGDKASSFKWLVEGLAMHEEVSKMTDSDRTAYANLKANQLRQNRVPFSQMTFFVSNSEENRRTDSWTQQVESVVSYLLAQGSALSFAQLLSELRSVDIDRALSDAYPGKFRSLSELENLWKYTI